MTVGARRISVLELRSVRGRGGGPEKTILLGAERADRSQFDVTVCYIRDARDRVFGIGGRAAHLGSRYVEIMERNSLDPLIWPALRQLLRDRRVDIVHAHEYKTNLLALLLARADGIIPVSTAHGWSGHGPRERFCYYPIDRQLLRLFPITIAVSTEIRDVLVRAGVRPERVRVILNGIDQHQFHRNRSQESAVRRQLGLSLDDTVVGIVGSLEACKRVDLAIRSCGLLRARWPKLKLLIAGDGSLAPALRRLAARLLPDEAYRFLGHRDDVIALHHALDVFVLSSDHEGTPNTVLEAMALETPVVVTSAASAIIEDGVEGLVVPTGDEHALARAIERVLVEPDRTAARVARARACVETSLSFDARMASLDQVYRDVMRQHRGRMMSDAAA